MIISHKYKFIFLKTSKTAGTSIEIALSEFCDEDDIITPISPKDERIRSDLGFCGPQNFISSFKEYEFLDWINFFFKYKNKRKRQYYNHITALRAKRLLGEKKWKEYYKFCFVRNPWDRVVSQYYWRTQEPRPHIFKFLKSKHFKDLYKKGENIYKINNEIVVDKVYKFENINSAMLELEKKLGFPKKLKLPLTKSSTRVNKKDYHNLLSEREKLYIHQRFKNEIIEFKYEY